jgi:hypothetical protein
MLSPKDALLEGARLIEVHGHYKGDYGRPDIGFCASGAVWWAIAGRPRRNVEGVGEENLRYVEVIRLLHDRVGAVGPWNDKPERTKEEVVGLLRQVAEENS